VPGYAATRASSGSWSPSDPAPPAPPPRPPGPRSPRPPPPTPRRLSPARGPAASRSQRAEVFSPRSSSPSDPSLGTRPSVLQCAAVSSVVQLNTATCLKALLWPA
jgi:hypothetical protein